MNFISMMSFHEGKPSVMKYSFNKANTESLEIISKMLEQLPSCDEYELLIEDQRLLYNRLAGFELGSKKLLDTILIDLYSRDLNS